MDLESHLYNGIIVTDRWILTSATACLNIYNSPWNDYVIIAGSHNLTESNDDLAIKDYHIYSKEKENDEKGCNQHDDYCLIELATQLVISEHIQAIGFQHFTTSSTSTTTDRTTTWDSTWHPGLTTSTATTITTTTSTTTTTFSTTTTIMSTSTTTWDSTWFPWLTTTKKDTKPTPSFNDSFDKCWIAAWSDNNLRTFKVDISNSGYCDPYYPSEHRPFRKHKLSTKEQAKLKKKMQDNKKSNFPEPPNDIDDVDDADIDDAIAAVVEQIIDTIMNPQGLNYYGERTHICIDNLRNVCIKTNSYFRLDKDHLKDQM